MSEIFIAGTIASHPEIRYTRDGRAHTTFCLVVDRSCERRGCVDGHDNLPVGGHESPR